MKNIGRKTRLLIAVSALYVMGCVLTIPSFNLHEEMCGIYDKVPLFVYFTLLMIPLVVVWGVWWIVDGWRGRGRKPIREIPTAKSLSPTVDMQKPETERRAQPLTKRQKIVVAATSCVIVLSLVASLATEITRPNTALTLAFNALQQTVSHFLSIGGLLILGILAFLFNRFKQPE